VKGFREDWCGEEMGRRKRVYIVGKRGRKNNK